MRILKTWALLAASFIVLTATGQGEKTPVKVTDLLKIKSIGGVVFNPQASKIAFIVTVIIADEKMAGEFVYQSQVWMARPDGSRPVQLTTAKEGASNPVWSPDGSTLAFLRPIEGKPQIFLLQFEGGEPRQLTSWKYGAGNPVWSPDGKQILFTSSIGLREYANDTSLNPKKALPAYPLEKPKLANSFLLNSPEKPNADGSLPEVRAYLAKNEQDKKAKVIDKLIFQEESGTTGDMNLTHLFLINTTSDSRPIPVTSGFYSYSNPQFVGNSSQLLVETDLDSTEHPDRSQESELWVLSADGKGLRKILGKNGMAYSSAAVSPSGKWLAFQMAKTAEVNIPVLAIMPMTGKESDIVTIPFDRNKQALTWSSNEQCLYFTAPSNGGVVLHKLDMATRKISALTSETIGVGSFDEKAGLLSFVKNEVANPCELMVADGEARQPKALTSLNSGWVANTLLSMPEKHVFKNSLGQDMDYWVMKPVNYTPGKKYPLLLEMHGGPAAMWGPGENSMWHEFQYFCSKGYGVVYCNPRGSGGYGESFLRANMNDWGTGPASDVLTALDKTIAEGWADTSRLLLTGGSYAGYLAAWIVGHDNRFKAACAQRGVYDLRTFFGEGNAWRLVPNYFGGYAWNKATYATLERESPINYVQNVNTPLIIFHGENDLRTGVIQSEQFYKSLKVLGKTVEYVRHPGGTHELTRSGNNRQRIDQMLRTWEFFERFIGQ